MDDRDRSPPDSPVYPSERWVARLPTLSVRMIDFEEPVATASRCRSVADAAAQPSLLLFRLVVRKEASRSMSGRVRRLTSPALRESGRLGRLAWTLLGVAEAALRRRGRAAGQPNESTASASDIATRRRYPMPCR